MHAAVSASSSRSGGDGWLWGRRGGVEEALWGGSGQPHRWSIDNSLSIDLEKKRIVSDARGVVAAPQVLVVIVTRDGELPSVIKPEEAVEEASLGPPSLTAK